MHYIKQQPFIVFFSLALTATPDDNGWESKLVSEIEKQEKEVQKMREQQEFSLLRVRLSF